jgi:hypothetical protein
MSPFVQGSDDFRRCGFKIGKIPGREYFDREGGAKPKHIDSPNHPPAIAQRNSNCQ